MGRTPTPCCPYVRLNKGPWTPEEDLRLINYIQTHGQGNWRSVPKKAGLQRCGKGCRLRWMNYLRPNVKRGHILPDEEDMIIRLHKLLGNRWSLIAGRIPGRTDNEVKNYWNTHLRKKDSVTKGHPHNIGMGCDKSCEKQTRALCIIEKGSSFSPSKDVGSTRHIVKNHNENSARSHIGEIVSILRGAEELIYDRTAYEAQDAESIENLKQLIDGFHYPAIPMDSISNIHSAWPYENHHPSSYVPSIYPPEFEPKTCPSDSIIQGLYHSMSDGSTSMQGQESWLQVHSLVSGNYMNSRDKTISDVIHNMKLETEAEPQFHNHPFVFGTEDVLPTEYCNVFVPCSNAVLPDLQLGQNMILNTLQPEDSTTSQFSEPWFSSSDWFKHIKQLYS